VPTHDLGPITLYAERSGTGERLLFISGTGGDLRNKPSVFNGPLGTRFEILAYDQHGLGQSAVPDGPYTLADYADDAARLLNRSAGTAVWSWASHSVGSVRASWN
jgi:3-oxoadipate enol-lactonase